MHGGSFVNPQPAIPQELERRRIVRLAFSAAHRVLDSPRCGLIHGHDFVVWAHLVPIEGISARVEADADFRQDAEIVLRRELKSHLLLQQGDPLLNPLEEGASARQEHCDRFRIKELDFAPTFEGLARHLFGLFGAPALAGGFYVVKVAVFNALDEGASFGFEP